MRYVQAIEGKSIRIDAKDRKILAAIAENARSPATVIAKKAGTSRDTAKYRIDSLQKNGIIQGYRAVVNTAKLGFDAYHIFLQLNKPSREIEQDLIRKFKAYPFLRALLKFNGRYDFEVAVIAKSVADFDNILDTVLNDCAKYLQDYEVMIISKTYLARTFPRSFLDYKTMQKGKIKAYSPDEKDRKLLSAIADNASLPLYKLASIMGLSPDAANYRIKHMVDEGIIIGFVPIINYSALGYSVYAVLVLINGLSADKESRLKQFINSDGHIIWAVKTVGKHNLLLYVCVKDNDELHETINSLRTYLPNDIRNYEPLIAYEEFHYTYFPESAIKK
ncbi:MAG: Lrp/AsnC family transcriptional regulator [Nanoarchaeota archaeon]